MCAALQGIPLTAQHEVSRSQVTGLGAPVYVPLGVVYTGVYLTFLEMCAPVTISN